MSAAILIYTNPTDEHAHAVRFALERKGAVVRQLHTADFPRQGSISLGNEGRWFHECRGFGMEAVEFDPATIWHRRPRAPEPPQWIDPADRAHARAESRALFDAFTATLPASAFWVNPYPARDLANHKPLQLKLARECGFSVPPTLFSNDPERIRAFARANGEVVYKPFTSTGCWSEGSRVVATFTSALRIEHLADGQLLAACPGIYQRHIAKSHELRVTMIGNRAFAARIDSQSTERGKLDWRLANGEFAMTQVSLPPQVERACHRLMARLNLVFGAIDLIVTPAGEHVFLEINEMGQFLFVEHLSGMPLLDAFCELLIQGRADYAWDPREPALRLHDGFTEQARAAIAQAVDSHVMPEETYPVPEAQAAADGG